MLTPRKVSSPSYRGAIVDIGIATELCARDGGFFRCQASAVAAGVLLGMLGG